MVKHIYKYCQVNEWDCICLVAIEFIFILCILSADSGNRGRGVSL